MVSYLKIAEILSGAGGLRQSSLPASVLPTSQNPLRALSFSSFYYSLRVGEEGRTDAENACAAWELPCPTSALPAFEVGHALICRLWSLPDA
jgi:hypothetical protein